MANSGIVGALKVLLGLDTAEFDKGIKSTKAKAASLESSFTGVGRGLAGALLPATSLAGVGLLFAKFAKDSFAAADSLVGLAAKTGISIEELQRMEFAARQTGTTLEALTTGAFKLGVNIENGTKAARDAIKGLGLSFDDVKRMKPEDQFNVVIKALEGVESTTERNRIGVLLFGKNFSEIAKAVGDGYSKMRDQASVAGAAQVKALDAAGDAIDRLKQKIGAVGLRIFGNLASEIVDTAASVDSLNESQLAEYRTLLKAGEGYQYLLKVQRERNQFQRDHELPAQDQTAKATHTLVTALSEARAEVSSLTTDQKKQILAGFELGQSMQDISDATGVSVSALRLYKESADSSARSTKQLTDEQDKWNESILSVNRSAFAMLQWMEPFKAGLRDIGVEVANLRQGFTSEGLIPSDVIGDNADAIREADADLLKWANDHGAVLAPAVQQSSSAIADSTEEIYDWGKNLQDILKGIPALLSRAFEGGGNLSGAVKSLGVQIGNWLSEGIASSVKTSLGGGAAAGIVGGIVGGFVGFGISFAAKSFNDMLHLNDAQNAATKSARKLEFELLRQYGTLADLEKAARQVGVSFEAVWGRKGLIGLQLLTSAAERFQKALADLNQQKLGLEDEIKDTRSELEGLIGDAARLGYIFDKQGNLIAVDFRKMQEMADKFGLSQEALGKSFHNARLAAGWKEIVDVIELFAKGGTDAGTILTGLKDEIGHLVSDSIKFGTKIPENMRPWIQNLIDTGQLIDDNGQKITDISQINFGPEIKSEFDIVAGAIRDVITKLDALITRLDVLIAKLDSLPHPEAPWAGWPDPPGMPDYGQPPAPSDDVVPLAMGGLVRRATRALIGEGGQPELVGPVSFMAQALRGAIQSLGAGSSGVGSIGLSPSFAGALPSGSVTNYNTYNTYEINTLDGDSFENIVRNKITPQQRRDLSNNTGGVRTGFKNDLGI